MYIFNRNHIYLTKMLLQVFRYSDRKNSTLEVVHGSPIPDVSPGFFYIRKFTVCNCYVYKSGHQLSELSKH